MKYLILLLLLVGCSTAPTNTQITLPKNNPQAVIIDHLGFQVSYDKKFRLPIYVKYTVTAQQLKSKLGKRKNKFFEDPKLVEMGIPFVTAKDYKYSGYDMGHMAPAADFSRDQRAIDETFVMSNIAPQTPGLNRGAWKALEEQVRRWGCGEEKITVFTGPILEENLDTLKSGIPIPKQFFKIVIDETPPKKVLAVIYNQTDKNVSYKERLVKVNEIKKSVANLEIQYSEDRNISQENEWKESDCR